jgi:hypothetical protein
MDITSILRVPYLRITAIMSLLFIVIYIYSALLFIYMHKRALYTWFSLYSVFGFITLKLGLAPII